MVTGSTRPALVLDRVRVAYGSQVVCDSVSLSVGAGSIYALLGREGAGKSSLLAAVAGDRKPSRGCVLLDGLDTWRERGKARRIISGITSKSRPTPDDALAQALSTGHRLVLLDEFEFGSEPGRRSEISRMLREAAKNGTTVVLASARAVDAEGLADRLGFICDGKLRIDEPAEALARRFRRIRYSNEVTATRTEYGTELDSFDAPRVRVRGSGVEAIVSNFTDALFERFRGTDGVVEAEASSLTLEEIFEAVCPAASTPPGKVPRRGRRFW